LLNFPFTVELDCSLAVHLIAIMSSCSDRLHCQWSSAVSGCH